MQSAKSEGLEDDKRDYPAWGERWTTEAIEKSVSLRKDAPPCPGKKRTNKIRAEIAKRGGGDSAALWRNRDAAYSSREPMPRPEGGRHA